jgi:hypothetical protein
MKQLLLTALISLLTLSQAYAGGGGLPEKTQDVVLVTCNAAVPNRLGIEKLIYFARASANLPFSKDSIRSTGLYLAGSKFDTTIIALKGNIHSLTEVGAAPQSFQGNNFVSLGWNVRQLQITARGSDIFLSMVAGATGEMIVKNLKMNCGQ